MNNLIEYAPLFFQGTLITIASWIVSGSISLLLGTIIGILSCQYLTSAPYDMLVKIYTFIAKGIPAYVQILIAYFVIPSLLGINISGFVSANCALAFCSSGYVTEIIRSGINTIPRGQWDSCFVLGYPLRSTLRRIIMPQAIQNVLPSLLGELEQLLKSTALLATVGVTEITRTGMNIISRELNPFPVYLSIACIYLLLSAILQFIKIFAKRNIYGYHQ